jgi:hypothetical protein
MINELKEHFEKLKDYKGNVEHNVQILNEHFLSETERIKEIFGHINEKYNYDNYDKLVDLPELDTHIELWRGSGEFDLAVMQASLNGVYDPDPDFGRFYDIYESGIWKHFKELENDGQRDLFYQIQYDLFYTWISAIWQDLHSKLGGFPLKLLENNAASIFGLIDFAWYDNSVYHNFLDKPIRRKNYFNRRLHISEIYSRVKIPYKIEMNCSRLMQKDNETIHLKIDDKAISLTNLNSNELLYNYNIQKVTYENSVLFVQKHNELLNENWKDITYANKNGR